MFQAERGVTSLIPSILVGITLGSGSIFFGSQNNFSKIIKILIHAAVKSGFKSGGYLICKITKHLFRIAQVFVNLLNLNCRVAAKKAGQKKPV
mgnify:CR=1 FL=1